jgi:hypothetical protein
MLPPGRVRSLPVFPPSLFIEEHPHIPGRPWRSKDLLKGGSRHRLPIPEMMSSHEQRGYHRANATGSRYHRGHCPAYSSQRSRRGAASLGDLILGTSVSHAAQQESIAGSVVNAWAASLIPSDIVR